MDERSAPPEPAGYRHPHYAASFSEWARPLHLPGSNGWLLARQIPGTPHWDAMGTYPLFCCDDWTQLGNDLSNIAMDLVSVVLVTDPFGNYTQQCLDASFDNARHFKDHFVVDLTRPLEENVTKKNRATARRALRKVRVQLVPDPAGCIDTWMDLYTGMIRRQKVTGIRNFSRESFLMQLKTPGAFVFEAVAEDQVIGLDMIYVDNDTAYGHVCAFNELGYTLRASYATRWRMLEFLKGRVRFLDFGASVGTEANSEDDGLASYKKRWCSVTRPVFLCSAVFDQKVYDQLSRQHSGPEKVAYFPAYRRGEY